jgi:hypothetical protein
MAGVDPTGGLTEAAAKYYELQARIEQSQGRQQTLEAAIAKEVQRKAAANVPVAVDVSGLASVQELEAALSAVEPKQIDVILNALGTESIKEAQKLIQSLDSEARKKIDQTRSNELERASKATAAAQRSAMASAQSQAQANRVATMTPQEQLDFEMQGLADLEGFVGPEVEAQKQAAIGRIMALQSQIQNQGQGAMVGSFGASALQRIGFASNEFFDTRRREDPEKETKRAADAAKEILKILQGGEPLVLPASN